jgi:hypothetical protein
MTDGGSLVDGRLASSANFNFFAFFDVFAGLFLSFFLAGSHADSKGTSSTSIQRKKDLMSGFMIMMTVSDLEDMRSDLFTRGVRRGRLAVIDDFFHRFEELDLVHLENKSQYDHLLKKSTPEHTTELHEKIIDALTLLVFRSSW